MDSSYRPQSPDLSSYAPQSPDLSGYQPQSPDLSGALPPPQFGGAYQQQHQPQFGVPYGTSPTSVPIYQGYLDQSQQQHQQQAYGMPLSNFKIEPDESMPDAPQKRSRKNHQSLPSLDANGPLIKIEQSQLTAPLAGMSTKPHVDPTLGVQLKTSFPVARIKRIMQADEDIGKVAQVTPHVVSRALELFMIKLISASAAQARGPQGTGAAGGGGKGPKRILAQHLKKAVQENETFDFLAEIVGKVPDAPLKAKRDVGSDSEDGGSGGVGKAKKKGKRRKDSGDDF